MRPWLAKVPPCGTCASDRASVYVSPGYRGNKARTQDGWRFFASRPDPPFRAVRVASPDGVLTIQERRFYEKLLIGCLINGLIGFNTEIRHGVFSFD